MHFCSNFLYRYCHENIVIVCLFWRKQLESLDEDALRCRTHLCNIDFYASPSSREAYRDRQLTTYFELKFFVCWHVSIWGFQNRVCLYPEKRNHPGFVNISLTLVNDTSMERSLRVLHHANRKIWFFFQKSLKLTKLNFVRTPSVDTLRKEIALALLISVLH